MIHPTAIIHSRAELDTTVEVGPYTVIEEGVVIGPRCRIGPHVHLSGLTTIGEDNVIHPGCVIGNIPQDLKYRGAPSRLRIGDRNSFREHVTVNRATDESEDTVIGSGNLLMASCHVAHNVRIENGVILANGVLLGGHALVEDRAIISGCGLVHQFVRVGTLAMTRGGTAASQDLPPYTMALEVNTLCGLNAIGLRRAGISAATRSELMQIYRLLFRGHLPLRQAVVDARAKAVSPEAKRLVEFVASTKRGVSQDISQRRRQGSQTTSAEH